MVQSSEGMVSALQQMDPTEFEHFIADLWAQQGWSTSVTQASADRGVDVIAKKQNPFYQKHIIQAKRYSSENKIGSPAVQQYSSLLYQEDDVDAVIIVTTSSFSHQARSIAQDLNIKLISGEDIHDIVKNAGANDLLKKYDITKEKEDTPNTNYVTTIDEEPQKVSSSKKQLGTSYQNNYQRDNQTVRVRDASVFSSCPICDSDSISMNLSVPEAYFCPECTAKFEKVGRDRYSLTEVGDESSHLQSAAGSESNLNEYVFSRSDWKNLGTLDEPTKEDLEKLHSDGPLVDIYDPITIGIVLFVLGILASSILLLVLNYTLGAIFFSMLWISFSILVMSAVT